MEFVYRLYIYGVKLNIVYTSPSPNFNLKVYKRLKIRFLPNPFICLRSDEIQSLHLLTKIILSYFLTCRDKFVFYKLIVKQINL